MLLDEGFVSGASPVKDWFEFKLLKVDQGVFFKFCIHRQALNVALGDQEVVRVLLLERQDFS